MRLEFESFCENDQRRYAGVGAIKLGCVVKIVTDHAARKPIKPGVLRTNLSARQIVKKLKEAGFDGGRRAVRRSPPKHRPGRRKAVITGGGLNRNRQFYNTARIKKECLDAGDPVVSMDCPLARQRPSVAFRLLRQAMVRRLSPD